MRSIAAILLFLGSVAAQTTNLDNFVDFETCYFELNQEDRNGDRTLNEDEYLQFVKDFGGRTECLAGVTNMPLEFRLVWNQLSCECRFRGGSSDCCLGDNANIPVAGTLVGQGERNVVREQTYLRQVCLRTDQAVITFCGPPPNPPLNPPPPVNGIVPPGPIVRSPPPPLNTGERTGIGLAGLFLLILLCCRRRRWCLFASKMYESDESSSSSSSEDSLSSEGEAGARALEEGDIEDPPPPEPEPIPAMALAAIPDGDNEGDKDGSKIRYGGEEEEESDDEVMYSRTVQEPEWEDEEYDRRAAYEQGELPEEPPEELALRHVPTPPPEPEPEDPYELEHYVPDGGVYFPERHWEGGYEADGGWTPEEREGKAPVVFAPKKYERQVKEVPEPVDNRKQRTLEALSGGAIFDQLESGEPEPSGGGGGPSGMFDWVISSAIDTLDEKGDQLEGSEHSSTRSD